MRYKEWHLRVVGGLRGFERLVMVLDLEDAVCIECHHNVDIGNSSRHRRDAFECEVTELVAVRGLRPFALVDVDIELHLPSRLQLWLPLRLRLA